MNEFQNRKDWMLTHSTRKVFPLDFQDADIDLGDIATSLAKQCRYNGHVKGFYSVAEHSILVSRALERDGFDVVTQRTGLLHDAAECYTGDVIRPLKNALTLKGFSLKPFELAIEEKISAHFGLPWPWNPVVEQYDTRILRDEKDQLKYDPTDDWSAYGVPKEGLGCKIQGLEWQTARYAYLARCAELHIIDANDINQYWEGGV